MFILAMRFRLSTWCNMPAGAVPWVWLPILTIQRIGVGVAVVVAGVVTGFACTFANCTKPTMHISDVETFTYNFTSVPWFLIACSTICSYP